MKKGILTFLLSALLLGVSQHLRADDYDLYLVGLQGEGYTPLGLASLRSLSFSQTREENAEGVRVYINRVSANYHDGTSVAYDLSQFSAFVFSSKAVGVDGLSEADASSRMPFMYDGQEIVASCSGVASVYQMDGRLLLTRSLSAGETLSVSALTTGVYIVKLGGCAAKIRVK